MSERPYIRSKSIEIEGVKVKLPPVGQVWNKFTNRYEKRPIIKRSSIKKDQYWERDPYDYGKFRKEEIKKTRSDPEFVNHDLQRFRKREWDRRINGVWFYNNGEATYLSGLYYFYLQWWTKDDGGGLDFRIPDWEFFLLWEHIENDPDILGLILATKRRQGKTSKSGVILYEKISRSFGKHAGIQSKTDHDAKDTVYKEAVLNQFSRLPDFFRPIYDTTAGVLPKSGIFFNSPAEKGKTSSVDDLGVSLGSSITYNSSKPVAYDGKRLERYVSDECGKLALFSIVTRHSIVKPTAKNNRTGKFDGKMLYTTTVEEPQEGGEEFMKLWKSSDQRNIGETGQTSSGLYQMFVPAYKCYMHDKYGFPDELENEKTLLAQRKQAKDEGDTQALVSLIRQDPFTIEEAFMFNTAGCLYDAMKISLRLQDITWIDEKDLFYKGNFEWIGGEEDGEVEFKESSNGRFLISRRIPTLDASQWNKVEVMDTKKRPLNSSKMIIGVDPFDQDTTIDNRRSDGAAYLYSKFDITDPNLSETFLAEYIHRTPKVEMFYEDMIKMAHFFGCKLFPERNKVGLNKYVERRGYDKFLLYIDEQKEAGVFANTKTHTQLSEETNRYIYDNTEKVDFVHLLQSWADFDISKTQKYDAAMAAGWALVGAAEARLFRKTAKIQKKANSSDFKRIARLL